MTEFMEKDIKSIKTILIGLSIQVSFISLFLFFYELGISGYDLFAILTPIGILVTLVGIFKK